MRSSCAATIAGAHWPAKCTRFVTRCAALCTIFLIAACAVSSRTKEQNSLITATQSIERRAAQAYAAGQLDTSAQGYGSAALVYESLALAEPWARAKLSAARAVAETGRMPEALAMVDAVLARSDALSTGTRITAHGRAAALQLGLASPSAALPVASASTANASSASAPTTTVTVASTPAADTASALASALDHWQQANQLCATSCEQNAALLVLRARLSLAQGQASAAVQNASAALALLGAPSAAMERANALRARAQAYSAQSQAAAALADASAALALDQEAANAARVQTDLQLMAAAHQALGNSAEAARLTAQAERAQLARQQLRYGAP
jgi:tetratricopeptide (TPR) repeat protein